MDPAVIIAHCEDHLFPTLKLNVWERLLYYHLLRHTRFEGKSTTLVSMAPLANAVGIAESTTRENIRSLNERGCVRIEKRSRSGHLIRVLLPEEIPGVVPMADAAQQIELTDLDFFAGRRFLAALIARENSRCFYCLRSVDPNSCELDHVISRMNRTDNSFRNIVCSCHECNTTKQAQSPSDFLRLLYRRGMLSQAELEGRVAALEQLQAGMLVPDAGMVRAAAISKSPAYGKSRPRT